MKQFNLEEYKKNLTRKVCTRNGNIAEIIYTNGKGAFPVIVIDPYEKETEPWQVTENGKFFGNGDDDKLDLFFADEEDELTELQKTLEEDCDCYVNLYNDGKTREELREWIKCWCNSIIDLVRKELYKEQENCVVVPENDYYKQLSVQYQKGKQDALKDLPKLKKATEHKEFEVHVCVMDEDMHPYLDTEVNEGEYYIEFSDLKTLPKEK